MGAGALWHKQPRFKTSVVFFLLDQGKRKKKSTIVHNQGFSPQKRVFNQWGSVKG